MQTIMADSQFTLENVRLFMLEKGGMCTNHDVVARFKPFLNDSVRKLENRNKLKEFVQLLATVETHNGEKVLVLKKRYSEQGCRNIFSQQEYVQPAERDPLPSQISVPDAFSPPSIPDLIEAPPRQNRNSRSAAPPPQPPPLSGQNENSEFGFYGSYSRNGSQSQPNMSEMARNTTVTATESIPSSAWSETTSSTNSLNSLNSNTSVVPNSNGIPYNSSNTVEEDSMGFYSKLASKKYSSPSIAPPPIPTIIEPEPTPDPPSNNEIQQPGPKIINESSDNESTVPNDQNIMMTPQGTNDGSLKKTPMSAKDRIKHFNEKISTEKATEASKVAPPRNRSSRESRASASVQKEHQIEPDDDGIEMVSPTAITGHPAKPDQQELKAKSFIIDVLDAKEKQWLLTSAACDYHKMNKLLTDQPDLAHRRDFMTGNAMHWAAKLGKPDVIKLLNAHKVDVNLRSHCGYTPLHLAAMSGSEECIDLLVNLCKALPNSRDFYGKRPKQYLKKTCSTKIQQMLINNARQVFTVVASADEATSFARTQSFSAKIMKTTQGFARKLSSSSSRSVTDSGRELRNIASISETPDSSPGEQRKSSAEGYDSHRQSSVPPSFGVGSSSESDITQHYGNGKYSSQQQYRASSVSRQSQLLNEMYRSESAPDFKVPDTPRHTPPVFMNIREF